MTGQGDEKNSRILVVKSLECPCMEPELYCRLMGEPLKFLKQRRSEWSGSYSGDQSGEDQSGGDTFCCNAGMDLSEE